MAEGIPAIRVTDPHSRDTTPQSPPPPVVQTQFKSGNNLDNGSPRSGSPKDGRPNTSSGIPTSPAKLLRSLSNISSQQNGQAPPMSADHSATAVAATSPEAQQTPIDPLSQHILRRTNNLHNTPPGLLRPTTSGASATSGTSDDRPSEDKSEAFSSSIRQSTRTDTGLSVTTKEKRKGVSFLSRIIDRTKKKDTDDDAASSSVSEAQSELRPEGMEAQVFSQPVSNLGYEPRHAQPPAYIRVRARYKKERDFDRVFLAQELEGSKRPQKQDDAKSIRSVRSRSGTRSGPDTNPDTIWAMQFSKDGRYLAAAGQDKIIRVWAVISRPEERREDSMEDDNSDFPDHRQMRLSAPVFRSKPIREFEGHSSSVLDLTWSKNNFLLSSSMDKTVRLWHISRDECLCTFKHNDFVTSIAFHPLDDRFFLAGSLDAKLRLWSIPDKTVAYWNNLGDMITAVEFTPDGKYAIGGCLNGVCMFYETEGLRYQTQIHVRSARGKNAKGSKITNIQAINYPPNTSSGVTKLLITSNDSRIRLYNFRDKSLEIKFRGNMNNSSQIRANFSDDARYIICGSEDSKAYIWNMSLEDGDKGHKRPMEVFTASDTTTTCVMFAPSKTRQILGRSLDPMYDICNPPPVTLLSREEAESRNSSRAPTEDGESPPDPEARYKKQEESPAYTARASHKSGNIIVTADSNGRIKVFRQDCAWAKRMKDNWETSSVFAKASGVRRTASIATRGSSRSLRSAGGSIRTQPPSERILSWRQGINSTPSITGSSLRSGKEGNRSVSPRKSSSQLSSRSNKTQARPQSLKGAMGPPPLPVGVNGSNPPTPKSKRGDIAVRQSEPLPSNLALRSLQADDTNPVGMTEESSTMFWQMAKSSAISHRLHHPNGSDPNLDKDGHRRPATSPGLAPPHPLERNVSKVSTLTIDRSDLSGSESSDDEFMDALDAQHPHHHHHHVGEDDQVHHYRNRSSNSEVVCRHCSGNRFKAARSKDGETRLCCVDCGTPA